MENFPHPWLSEMCNLQGAEDPTFSYHCEMNSLEEFTRQQMESEHGEDFHQSFTSDSFSSYSPFNPRSNNTTNFSCSSKERPTKQLKTNSWNSCTTKNVSTPKSSSSPIILSFGDPNSTTEPQMLYENVVGAVKSKEKPLNQNYASKAGQGNKRAGTETTKSPSHVQDHIIAERKRRERLNERFIALSAIVPGLKKMDKASVLGEATTYLKQLQERVKTLEDQTTKKNMESVVFVKKSKLWADDNTSSFDENFTHESLDEPLPEIEARVSGKNVLIRIQCEKRKGILAKTLVEIEKLHLTVVKSNAMPFGDSVLDLTFMAQMDVPFCMTVKDLVKNLRSAFSHFI